MNVVNNLFLGISHQFAKLPDLSRITTVAIAQLQKIVEHSNLSNHLVTLCKDMTGDLGDALTIPLLFDRCVNLW